jgi:subtilase family serine protease
VVVVALLVSSFLSVVQPQTVTATSSRLQGGLPFPGFERQGQAPQDLDVLASIAIPLRNVNSLSSLAKQVSDPSSPLFRHFLTRQQVKEDFLPTAAYDSMLQYLQSTGLRVVMTAMDSVIVVEGTVSQVELSLQTGMDIYSNGTSSYYQSNGPATFRGAYIYSSNATSIFARPALVSSAQPPGNVTFTEGGVSAKQLQPVYNATSLYRQGYDGSGQTIGLLDFYGSPTIAGDLSLFDRTFGFPDASFTITPIGPYDPNLGASLGWSTEISLDVETSHAMAPGASVDLYVANGALSLTDAISTVVQDGLVTTLSQSFGTPEWYYSESYYFGGPGFFMFNAILPDQYYAMGSLEGITFLSSSGDGGGSGFSSGPEGTPEYPATSAFVTAVGGTQTYFTSTQTGTSFVQTAWSSEAYVPNGVNSGGSGGGVSALEPRAWYQQGQSTPPSFPNGRMIPDLSLQAGVNPGTFIVDSGSLIVEGGTSESSPLLAGLLTLVAEASGGSLGLINPFLYAVADDSAMYAEAFSPITIGYIIPWTASYGYNLATGWGSPNIGEIASLYQSFSPPPSLDITGDITNATGGSQIEFTPGQVMEVTSSVASGTHVVTTGNFSVSLVTLSGTYLSTSLAYENSSHLWAANVTMGQQSGISYVIVSGSSGGVSGIGIGTIFAGYLASFVSPFATNPYTTSEPLAVQVSSTDLDGNPMPPQLVQMEVDSYSILGNRYTAVDAVKLANISDQNEINLTSSYPDGPASLVLRGSSYAYLPLVFGIYLQTSFIYPEVAAEPGSVAPGQSLIVIANPGAPLNVAGMISYETGRTIATDVATGSNVTATLLDPSGRPVAASDLAFQACAQALRACNGGASMINGYLQVPTNALPGLYTILLAANYSSFTLSGALGGSFFGEVLVSGRPSVPSTTLSPSTLYEGQVAQLVANVAYPNGTEVRYGEYTALIYPQELQDQYTSIMHAEYASSKLIPLSYSPQLDRWVGQVTLPSPYDAGDLSAFGGISLYYAGPYDAYVTGISFDGTPTVTSLSAQSGFFVQPFVYTAGQTLASPQQTYQLALDNVTIATSAVFSGDVFLSSNTIQGGNVTIVSSEIRGTLYVNDAQVTLVGVSGGKVVAQNSSLVLRQSTLESLQLTSSRVSLDGSSFQEVFPSLPTVQVQTPASGQNYEGTLGVNASVGGLQISTVSMYLDGVLLNTFQGGPPAYGFQLDTTSIPDGAHDLQVIAHQQDGLSSSTSVYFTTDSHLASAKATIDSLTLQLRAANSSISSLNGQLTAANSAIGSLGSQVQSADGSISSLADQLRSATYLLYALSVVAVSALLLAVLALRRNGQRQAPPAQLAAPPSPVEPIPPHTS